MAQSTERVGFIQGRLSPLVDGRIQAFPWDRWCDEYPAAEALGLRLMEWTLDQERLRDNPIMSRAGRAEIRRLGELHGVTVASLTGDCFMQAPFYKSDGSQREQLLDNLRAVVDACAELGVRFIVFPLVDNGRFEGSQHKENFLTGVSGVTDILVSSGVKIVFESDYPPAGLRRLIDLLPFTAFGINYDIGNSAALGYDPIEEIAAYGDRIDNVHVKDRVLGGATVPLGTGNAKLPVVFGALKRAGYRGNYIMQTARAADGDHAGALRRYRDMVLGWLGDGP